ncbi:MAG: Holliday junction resolvase Hjc [Candidatus Nanoarchaeia archaeon]|jgi:Holliday junction resolvase
MSRKSRGCEYERKLVHLLQSKGFSSVRVAGSGCMRYPSPDILASNNSRIIAFEVKSSQQDCVYIRKGVLDKLLLFSKSFGAEPWFAIHLVNKGWFFKCATELMELKFDENNTIDSFDTP